MALTQLGVDSFQDAPAPPTPVPVPGEALLTETETNKYYEFLDQMNRDSNVIPPFGGDAINAWAFLEEAEQLPSPFEEPTTSAGYGPHLPYETTSNMGTADQVFGNPFSSGPVPATVQPTTSSPRTMAAVNTLLRHRHPSYQSRITDDMINHFDTFSAHINPVRTESVPLEQRYFTSNTTNFFGNCSLGPYVHGSGTSMNNTLQSVSRAYSISNGHPAMMPNSALYNPPTFDRKDFIHRNEGPLLDFGSDENFANSGFMPPPNLETEEHLTDKLLQSLDSFEAQTSATNTAANTQPSSPIMPKSKRKSSAPNSKPKLPVHVNAAANEKDVGIAKKPKSTKRRKSKADVKAEEMVIDDEEDEWEEPKPRRGKRQKSTSATNNASGSNSNGPRAEQANTQARGSQSADRKSGRENLTDEQRRSNHIHSEQKRRNAIKDGYDELIGFVPGLRAGGFSRSASMTQAVDWLKELMNSNAQLRVQLDMLQEGVGARVA